MTSIRNKEINNEDRNSQESRNGGTGDNLSNMRRSGDTSSESSFSGARLSNVSENDTGREAEEIFSGSSDMGEGYLDYETFDDLETETRVSLLNAFIKIKKKNIFSGFSEDVKYILNREFSIWVEEQMNLLMRKTNFAGSFTEEEKIALKTLAQKILATQKGQKPVIQTPTPTNPTSKAVPVPSQGRPLRQNIEPQVDSEEWRKTQLSMLKQLEMMDRHTPDF